MSKGFLSFSGKQWAVIIVLFVLAILTSFIVNRYVPSLSPQFSPSYAATGASSGIIFVDDVNKRVGINTNLPTTDLYINESLLRTGPRISLDALSTNPGSVSGYQFTVNGVLKGGFYRERSTNDLQFYIANGSNVPSLVIKNSNNFVGIGTSNPTVKLDVNGDVKANKIQINTISSALGTCMNPRPELINNKWLLVCN